MSPRTFFNYFPSKEAALFGADPEQIPELRERIIHQAPASPRWKRCARSWSVTPRPSRAELSELTGDPAGGCAG